MIDVNYLKALLPAAKCYEKVPYKNMIFPALFLDKQGLYGFCDRVDSSLVFQFIKDLNLLPKQVYLFYEEDSGNGYFYSVSDSQFIGCNDITERLYMAYKNNSIPDRLKFYYDFTSPMDILYPTETD